MKMKKVLFVFFITVPLILTGAISITTVKYGNWEYVNFSKQQKYNDWCVYTVMSIYKSIFAPCDYADHYRTFRKQDVNPLNSCCYPLNHNICGGVPADILLPFWTQEFSENYWRTWDNVMNIFDDEKSSYCKDLPRIGVLDLRAMGATYHAVLLFYVEVSTSSIGVKEFWVYYQDPWIGSYRSVCNPLSFYAISN